MVSGSQSPQGQRNGKEWLSIFIRNISLLLSALLFWAFLAPLGHSMYETKTSKWLIWESSGLFLLVTQILNAPNSPHSGRTSRAPTTLLTLFENGCSSGIRIQNCNPGSTEPRRSTYYLSIPTLPNCTGWLQTISRIAARRVKLLGVA